MRTPRYISFMQLLYTQYIALYRVGIPNKGPSFCPLIVFPRVGPEPETSVSNPYQDPPMAL